MDTRLRERAEEFLKTEDSFRTNAFKIICVMVKLLHKGPKQFVDEMLQSIFFLGRINNPQYTPNDILGDDYEIMMNEKFPGPFESYERKLPKRTPFSCVLDMVASSFGPDEIQQKLSEIATEIGNQDRSLRNTSSKEHKFTSSTICISESEECYYGASMSCKGKIPGQIMIAVSCLHTWHYGVSNAVMTYKPDRNKRNNFDGTMQLPQCVKCQAFNVMSGEEMSPCKSCVDLFGLKTSAQSDKKRWAHGHCAEAESLSKLLYEEEEIEVARVEDEMREQVMAEVTAHLEANLRLSNFDWDSSYYTPQVIVRDDG
ncbi:uncharacterized protein LOC121571879 isoform X1 [Coregonus clupeaformis]|uniref:uncharacterized protein LOC121571879 isoform X1 n=1 Tax=Coregonus clupeaformis TaxID=59861 RepID=UPI001E1C96AC|nr:uncharacterized protein LOC121571879 isoform X1 [Coregonus clupeaformis]